PAGQAGAGPVRGQVHRAHHPQPGDPGALLDVSGHDVPVAARLRGHHPHGRTGIDVAQGVDHGVGEIAVALAPPQHDGVHDLLGVLVLELPADEVLDCVTQIEIDVV